MDLDPTKGNMRANVKVPQSATCLLFRTPNVQALAQQAFAIECDNAALHLSGVAGCSA
jgi:hypothetical protein